MNLHNFTSQLKQTKFLITGASGLIGSSLIHTLLSLNLGIRITAPVRNCAKAKLKFTDEEIPYIDFIEGNLIEFDYSEILGVDYIIHCAAPTASIFFIKHPVENSEFIYDTTKVLLKYAASSDIKGFVFLSSLEIYGTIIDDNEPVTEDVQGYLDPMSVRSSYPMAKRAAENLCCLYADEYNVPVKVARLTQTTGAGFAIDDNRIIAQFARLTAQGKDIVLHTTGESARPYCYTEDCVSAIIYILIKGNSGEAYNVANEETYISACKMAEYLRDNFNPNINVRFELNDNMGYAPVSKLRLSTRKLRNLGWESKFGLHEIFEKVINYIS